MVVPVVAVTAPNTGATIVAQELAVQFGAAVHAPVLVQVLTADSDRV